MTEIARTRTTLPDVSHRDPGDGQPTLFPDDPVCRSRAELGA